jgi:hypothetical protein
MEATRPRLGFAFEWAVALVFLAGTVGVGLLIIAELRALNRPPAAVPVPAEAPAPLPGLTISVPVLRFSDGVEIRTGDSFERVTTLLGRDAQDGMQVVDRGRLGERITCYYAHVGTRFVVVFEPFEVKGPPRATAIYIR